MEVFSDKDYQFLSEGLCLKLKNLEEKIEERMIETGIYFEEEDEKLAKLQQDKRNVEELQQRVIKNWRKCISEKM